MNIKNILILSLIIIQIIIILTEKSNELEHIKINGVFRIDSHKYSLIINDNKLKFSRKKDKREEYFRITPSNLNNSYYIESGLFNKFLGINDNNELIFEDKKDLNNFKIRWNIIQIKEKEFIIENVFSNNFLEIEIKKRKLLLLL